MPDPFVILSVILLLPVVLLLRFIGCGAFSGTDTPPPPVTIDQVPPISLGPGEIQTFTAKLDDGSAPTWSGSPGTIDSTSGLYTAPDPFDPNNKTSTATITASKKPDMMTGKIESASVTVTLIHSTITLSQSAMNAKPGQVISFTAAAQLTPDPKFTWTGAVPDMPQGPTAKYKAPDPYVLGSAPVTISVVNHADASAVATATVTLVGNAAVFVKKDITTQGSWKRAGSIVYGKDGYGLASSPNIVQPPAYLSNLKALLNAPSPPSSLLENTYAPKDARDLVDPSNLANTIAAVWYTAPTFKQFQFDLPFGDSQVHQLAVYSAIWDGQARAQIISILDGDNPSRTLDTQKLSGFDTGVYLVWNVSGHIVLQITNDTATNPASPNAVISGVFFG
jgi:hypothetical protein